MNKVIQVLETMAADALLANADKLNHFLDDAEINTQQQQAIMAQDMESLSDTLTDFSKLIAYSQVLPADEEAPVEDEKEDDNASSSKLLASSL